MKQEELLKILNKYGFQSLKKEPFLYVHEGLVGIAYSMKTPYYGELRRIYIPKNKQDAEDFLAKYAWYKKNKGQSVVTRELTNYNQKEAEIKYIKSSKELSKEELLKVKPEMKKNNGPSLIKEKAYLKKIKRTFLILIEIIEEKIKTQEVTYQNLVKLSKEYAEKQNVWNNLIKNKKNLNIEQTEQQDKELDKNTYEDTLNSWKEQLNDLQEKEQIEIYINELVNFLQSLEIEEGFLKNKYQLIKLPLEMKTLKEKIEILENLKNSKKGLFVKKENLDQIFTEIEEKNALNQIVSYEHYKENEINRIEEKYKIIPDLDIRTIGDYFIEFDNLKIEEPKVQEEIKPSQNISFEETMKELENGFMKRPKEEQELLIAYSYFLKNILTGTDEEQKNNLEDFKNTLSNPNNIMMKVKYFRNINLTSEEECLKSIRKIEERIKKIKHQQIKGDINVFWKSNRTIEESVRASSKRLLAPCQTVGENDILYIGKLKKGCEVLFIPSELKKDYLLGDTLVLEKNCPLFLIDFQKNDRKDENSVIIKVMNYEFKKKNKKITTVTDLENETVTLYKSTIIERI